MYVFSVGDMQAEHCQKELEICRNDLTTCLEASAQVQRLATPSQLLKHDHVLPQHPDYFVLVKLCTGTFSFVLMFLFGMVADS
jgi:hypothetical protein